MRELYDKVVEAYKAGDESKFLARVRNWLAEKRENPFTDVKAKQLYFEAMNYYNDWQSESISRRSSKVRMLNRIRWLMELNLPNPYENKTIVEPEISVSKTKHVFGVIPVNNEVCIVEDKPEETEKKKPVLKRKKQ